MKSTTDFKYYISMFLSMHSESINFLVSVNKTKLSISVEIKDGINIQKVNHETVLHNKTSVLQ